MTEDDALFSLEPTYQLAHGTAILTKTEWRKFLVVIQLQGLPVSWRAHKGLEHSHTQMEPFPEATPTTGSFQALSWCSRIEVFALIYF